MANIDMSGGYGTPLVLSRTKIGTGVAAIGYKSTRPFSDLRTRPGAPLTAAVFG